MSLKEFTINYTNRLINLIQNMDFDEFDKFYNLINNARGTIFIIGNGGSSSTASHIANDLGIGLKMRELKSLNVLSLCDNSAISYAIANDTDFDNIFYLQLKDVLKKEDIVIAISCSGNSPNIIKAIQYANQIGSKVVGFSGFDGGFLKQHSDIKLHIETSKGEYGLVEDSHLILNHILFTYFQLNQNSRNENV